MVLCGKDVMPVSAASCKGEWIAVFPLPISFSASSRSLIFSLTLGLKGASFLFLSTLALSYFLRIIGASFLSLNSLLSFKSPSMDTNGVGRVREVSDPNITTFLRTARQPRVELQNLGAGSQESGMGAMAGRKDKETCSEILPESLEMS